MHLQLKRPTLPAFKQVSRTVLRTRERSKAIIQGRREQSAVRSMRLAILVQVLRIEELTRTISAKTLLLSRSLVGGVLTEGVVAADLWVEGTREEVAAEV